MGAIGSGTSTSYPVTLDTLLYVSPGGLSDYTNGPNPIADSQSRVDAEFMNDVIDALIAIETELGTSPSGVYGSVAERFDTIGGAGGGFPGASTDNAIVRWNGSTGTSLQDSVMIVSDTGNVEGIVDLTITRNLLIGGTAAGTLLDNGIVIALGVGPSTQPTNAVQLWAADRAGSPGKTSLHVRAEDGTQHVFGDRVGIGTVAPSEALEVVGGIKLGTTALLANGTIRFTGADIEGRINDSWVSMTAGSAGGTTSGIWTWTTQTVTPPPGQRIGVNNSVYDLATQMYITEVSANGTDSSILLDDLNVGDTIYIQDKIDSSKYVRYTVAGDLTDSGDYRTIPVTFVSTGVANISNNAEIYVQFNLLGIHGSGATNAVTIWTDQYTLSADAQLHYESTSNNFGLKATTFGTGAQGVLALALGNAPTTSPVDTVQLWAADRGATGGKTGLHIRTEDGTSHVFSDFVGLNNLTPLAELDVVGTQRITRNATSSSTLWNVLNVRVKGTTDSLSPGFGSYISFINENFSGASFEIARIAGSRGPTDTDGILTFYVANATVFAKTISIDKDANLRINMSSVGTGLTQGIVIGSGIAPTTSPADAVQLWSADRAATVGKASLHLRTEDGTSHVFGDRVGIGTLTPGFSLDVVGAINVSDPTNTRSNLGLGTASTPEFLRIGIGTPSTASAPLIFATGTVQKILLQGDSISTRYGFGLASLALQIFSPTTARIDLGGMSTVDGTTFTSNLSVHNTSGNIGIGTGTFGTGATKTLALFNGVAPTTSPVDTIQMWSADRNATAGKGSLHLRTEDGTSHVFGDRVGIGTTNPTVALDVIGAIKVSDISTTQTNLGIGTGSSTQFDRLGLGTAASADARLTFLAELGQKVLLYGDNIAVRYGMGLASGTYQIFSASNGTVDIGSMSAADGITFTNRLSIQGSNGNIGLGTKTYGTSAVRNFVLFAGTAPTTSPVDAVSLWTEDQGAVAGEAALTLRTETGIVHSFGTNIGFGTTIPITPIHIVREGVHTSLTVDSYYTNSGASNLVFRKAYGTLAAPTRLGVNASLGNISGYAWARDAANTVDQFVLLSRLVQSVDSVDAQGRMGGRQTLSLSPGVSAAIVEMFRWDQGGNYHIGSTTTGTGLTRGLVMASGTAPATSIADQIQMWVADQHGVAGDAALHIMPEITTLYTFGNTFTMGSLGTPPAVAGGNVHLYGSSMVLTIDRNDTSITFPQIQMRKSRGTADVPLVTIEGDRTLGLYGLAYVRNAADTADAYQAGSLMMYRASNFDAQGRSGGDISWWTSSGVSASISEKMYLNPAGQLGLGPGLTYATVLPSGSLLNVSNLDVTTGSLTLVSQRAAIVSGNVLNGIEFWSNDTSYTTQPGYISAYLRVYATEAHASGAIGSRMVFATSLIGGASPSPRLTIDPWGTVIIGAAASPASMTGGLVISSGAAPTASVADGVLLWSADKEGAAGDAALHIRTEDGFVHVLGSEIGFNVSDPIGTLNVNGYNNYFERHDANAVGYNTINRKSRGTREVPVRLIAGDIVSYWSSQGYVRNAGNTADVWTYMTRIDSVVQSVDVEGRAGGVMIFYTCPPVTGSLTERMRITESGFVGIGISVPATTLHVGNSDVTDAGLALTSQRVAIAVDNVLNGVDFHSNDTNLSISTLTAYIRAYASETHTATTLGSRITFATTAIGAAAPTLRMTLMDTGVLSMGTWTGQKINLYDSTVNKYGLGIGSSQLQIYSPNAATTRTEIGGMSNTDGVTFIPVLRVLPSSTSMVLGPVGATAVGTSGTYVFGISTGTRATTSPTAMVQMWTEDQDGANTAALHVRSEGNWITKIGQGIITRAAYLTLTTYTTAAPYSPVALEESNRTFLASNTSAMTQVSLPAAAVGYVFKFIVTAAQGLRIRAFTGDTIRIGSTVTAAAGYIQSTTLGDYIELFATSSGGWYARSPIQGWTIGV